MMLVGRAGADGDPADYINFGTAGFPLRVSTPQLTTPS